MEVGAQTQGMRRLGSQISSAILIMILAGCTLRPDGPIGDSHLPPDDAATYGEPSATKDHAPSIPEATPEPGKGAVVGSVTLVATSGEETMVFLAPFFHDEGTSDGYFILEPSVHPHAYLQEDGRFQLTNVEPGEYILLIGRTPEAATAIRADDQPRILQVSADEVLDIGEIQHVMD